MHEMWCGADTSGEPVWHVLAVDKGLTLCGLERREEPLGRASADRHCLPCMKGFQAVMASADS
jgi:hypothetical protein